MHDRTKNSTRRTPRTLLCVGLGVTLVASSFSAAADPPPVDLARVTIAENARSTGKAKGKAGNDDTRPRFRGRNNLRPAGRDDIGRIEADVAPPAIAFPAGAKLEAEMLFEAMPVMEPRRPVALLSVEVLVARLAVMDHLTRRYAGDITACHARAEGPKEATVSVSFDVDPQGGVRALVVSSLDPRVRQCVRTRSASWRFPNALGDVIEVEASLLVHPGGLSRPPEAAGRAGFGRAR